MSLGEGYEQITGDSWAIVTILADTSLPGDEVWVVTGTDVVGIENAVDDLCGPDGPYASANDVVDDVTYLAAGGRIQLDEDGQLRNITPPFPRRQQVFE